MKLQLACAFALLAQGVCCQEAMLGVKGGAYNSDGFASSGVDAFGYNADGSAVSTQLAQPTQNVQAVGQALETPPTDAPENKEAKKAKKAKKNRTILTGSGPTAVAEHVRHVEGDRLYYYSGAMAYATPRMTDITDISIPFSTGLLQFPSPTVGFTDLMTVPLPTTSETSAPMTSA